MTGLSLDIVGGLVSYTKTAGQIDFDSAKADMGDKDGKAWFYV